MKTMKMTIDEALAVGILVASIDVPGMKPFVSEIKTLAESQTRWESVAERFMKEHRGLGRSETYSKFVVEKVCHICGLRFTAQAAKQAAHGPTMAYHESVLAMLLIGQAYVS